MNWSLTYWITEKESPNSKFRKKTSFKSLFLPKYLHISIKSCIFAADFNKISEVVLPILKKKSYLMAIK